MEITLMDYVLAVYVILMNTFGILDIWLLLKIFFGCDLRLTKKNMIISAIAFVVFDVVMSMIFFPAGNTMKVLQTLLIYGYVLLGTLFLTKTRKIKTLFLTIPALLLYVQSGTVSELTEKLFGLDRLYIMYGEEVKLTPLYSIADILLFVILIWIWRKSKRQEWKIELSVGEAIGVCVFCIFYPIATVAFEFYGEQGEDSIYNTVWVFFMLMLNIGAVYAVFHRKRSGYYQKVSENYKEQFSAEYSYFQDYKGKQQDTIKFRHDFQNHMLILQKMLQSEEYDRAKNYFSELSEKSGVTAQKILTGNEMLDMLLCIKQSELLENQIRVNVEGTIPNSFQIEPVDSCILFSNLLDNAIEANLQVKENRYISIKVKVINESLYLEMANPMSGKLKYEGDQPVTTKSSSGEHGIGLKNVSEVVNKYQGQYHIDGQDNIFTMQMVFPVK